MSGGFLFHLFSVFVETASMAEEKVLLYSYRVAVLLLITPVVVAFGKAKLIFIFMAFSSEFLCFFSSYL